MNYQCCDGWTEYYRETDPEKRRLLFKQMSDVFDDGANELRYRLYERRHTDNAHPGRIVDKGVLEIMLMSVNDSPIYRFSPFTAGSIRRSMTDLGIDEVCDANDMSASAVYWEIRNAARRYFENCKGPQYARKWFGMVASSDDEKLEKTAYDVWTMTVRIPEMYGMIEEMRIFSDAVRDEFTEMSEEARASYMRQVKQAKGKH